MDVGIHKKKTKQTNDYFYKASNQYQTKQTKQNKGYHTHSKKKYINSKIQNKSECNMH